MKPKGWRNESRRHSLASKGIKTAQKIPILPRERIKPKYDYEHSFFVNRKNGRVVSVSDVFQLGNKLFIQYRNPHGDSRRRTTLNQDDFLKLYREFNEKD